MYDLLHKHKVERTEELIALKDTLRAKLKGIQSFAVRIGELEEKIAALETEMEKLAGKIHAARVASEGKLREEMRGLLVGLGIKHALFKVDIVSLDHFTPTGKDDVTFLFSANKIRSRGNCRKWLPGEKSRD